MKKIILFFVMGFLLIPTVYSQSVSGKVSISGFSKDGTIKERTPVELFKSFKVNIYKIGFTFWGTYPPQSPILFDMKTTVKKNGKVIGTSNRPGWPWLPGDMYVPVEAFDFIPMLQKDKERIIRRSKREALSENYEIILEMNVSSGQKVSGSIEPVKFSFEL